jgi:glycosyltransferase involved in cell wall biosynthesis
MRIAMIGSYVEPPWADGVVNTVRSWSEGLRDLGVDVVVLSTSSDSKRELTLNGVQYVYLMRNRKRFSWNFETGIRFHYNVVRFMRKEKLEFDICHAHGFDSMPLYPFYAGTRIWASALCLSFHSRLDIGPRWRFRERARERLFDLFTVQNDDSREALLQAGIQTQRVGIIPPCVDTSAFSPKARDLCRGILNLPEDAFVIVYAGHFRPGRGIEDLIAVYRRIRRESDKRIILLLAWTGRATLHYMNTILNAMRGESDINILGPQKDMSVVYNSADVVVSPILGEEYVMTIPLNVLEAMACGRIAITTEVGAKGLLVNETNCYTIAPGDQTTMSKRIMAIVKGEVDVDRMGIQARRTVVGKFSKNVVASRLKNLYRVG